MWGKSKFPTLFGSFSQSKKNTLVFLEWKIEEHKRTFPARFTLSSTTSFFSSTTKITLIKTWWKTWQVLRRNITPRIAAICAPIIPATTNARIAWANEATTFVVAIGHIIINRIIVFKISLAIHNAPDMFFDSFHAMPNFENMFLKQKK